MIFEVTLIIILLGLSAFFSGSETALTSLTKVQLEELKTTKEKGYRQLQKFKENPRKMLITILIGNNLVNIFLSAYSTLLATRLFESNVLGIVVGIITFLVLVFGEIVPKNICLVYNKRIALLSSKFLLMIQLVLSPLIKLLEFINHSFFFILNIEEPNLKVTEDEIKTTLALGQKHGTLDKESKEIMNEVMEFSNTKVDEIMTSIGDIFFLHSNKKLSEVKDEIVKSSYSRIPVYDKVKKEYIGILHTSEILKALFRKKEDVVLKKLNLNPVMYVPDTKKIGELMKEFQEKRVHIALVIDEFGNIDGLVTLEDIIEELVGDILDETDRKDHFIKKINKSEFLIDGRVTLEYLRERLKLNLKSDDVSTLNGYLLESFGRVPKKGNKLMLGRKELVIDSCSKTRIKRVKLKY